MNASQVLAAFLLAAANAIPLPEYHRHTNARLALGRCMRADTRCPFVWRAGILTPPTGAIPDRTPCSAPAGHEGDHVFPST